MRRIASFDALRRSWLRLENADPRAMFAAILIAGIVVRMAISLSFGLYHDLQRYEMERTALSFANSGRLADPYLIPTGYTAHVAPGYPLILSAIFKLFGAGYAAEIVKNLLSSTISAAIYAFLPFVAPALGISPAAGIAAGWFGALVPLRPFTEIQGDWEAPLTGLAMLLLVWAAAVTLRDRKFSHRRALSLGAGWGAALLVSPSLLPVLIALSAAGYALAGRSELARYLAYSTVTVLTAILCLMPWAWRNERVLGSPIFTRSNFGLELSLSNNDLADPQEKANLRNGLYSRYHPAESLAQAEAVRNLGEVAYNRMQFRAAEDWIREHPRRFVQLTAERFFFTWFPRTTLLPLDLVFWSMTIGSALGVAALWGERRESAVLLIACLGSYTFVYYLIQVLVRYRYPLDWIFLLTSVSFAAAAVKRFFPRPQLLDGSVTEAPLRVQTAH